MGLEKGSLDLAFMPVPSHPISLPAIPIKFSEKQQACHYLYVREHRVREGITSSWPQKRTLFILNVPPYCTEVSWYREGTYRLKWASGRAGLPLAPTKSLLVRCKQLTEAPREGIQRAASLP